MVLTHGVLSFVAVMSCIIVERSQTKSSARFKKLVQLGKMCTVVYATEQLQFHGDPDYFCAVCHQCLSCVYVCMSLYLTGNQ